MLSSFVIVLREGFEAFLIVAIILAYLKKSGRRRLVGSVYIAIGAGVAISAALGWILHRGANQSLLEGIFGLIAIPFVVGLVVHMWRTGPQLKRRMEATLESRTAVPSGRAAYLGVFLFTVLMISREGMEAALMLVQVRGGHMLVGCILGVAAAGLMAWAWGHYGHRIDLRLFFQVTGIFLLMFTLQIALYSLHELAESGILVNPTVIAFHVATEPYSSIGRYGRWFPLVMVGVPAVWLLVASMKGRFGKAAVPSRATRPAGRASRSAEAR